MRNPRKDPQPGDALIYGPKWQRERVDVTEVGPGYVRGVMSCGSVLYSTRQWLEWMVGAEVIHAAG